MSGPHSFTMTTFVLFELARSKRMCLTDFTLGQRRCMAADVLIWLLRQEPLQILPCRHFGDTASFWTSARTYLRWLVTTMRRRQATHRFRLRINGLELKVPILSSTSTCTTQLVDAETNGINERASPNPEYSLGLAVRCRFVCSIESGSLPTRYDGTPPHCRRDKTPTCGKTAHHKAQQRAYGLC